MCQLHATCARPPPWVRPLMGGAALLPRRGETVSYQQPPDHEPGTAAGPSPGGYQDQDERAPHRYSAQWDQQAQPVPGWQEPRLLYPPPLPYGPPRQPSSAPDPHYGPPRGQPPYQGQPQYPPQPYGWDVYQQAQPCGQQPWPPPEPQGRPARTSWLRRHKVLTVLGGLAALIIIVGVTGGGNAKKASDASTVATTAPIHTATPSQTPPHHATKKKAKPKKTPVTASATTPAPAATAPAAAAAPPPATAPAVVPSSSAAAAPAGCHPLTNGGNCYEPGEYCRAADHEASGIAGDGKAITCEDNDGWRWEPS
jgi:hypothetical protein